jgi:hypothetical protein
MNIGEMRKSQGWRSGGYLRCLGLGTESQETEVGANEKLINLFTHVLEA